MKGSQKVHRVLHLGAGGLCLLEKEREVFAVERQDYVEKLMNFHRRVEEPETQLLQLAEPAGGPARKLEVRGDSPAST